MDGTVKSQPPAGEAVGKDGLAYTLGGELGRGSFATVYAGRGEDGAEYAVKRYCLDSLPPKCAEAALSEAQLLSSVTHPSLVGLRQVCVHDDCVDLVLYKAGGGTLAKYIKSEAAKIRESNIWKVFFQLASCLQHLHSKNILHRDVKPENVLFERPGLVRLADLSCSTMVPRGTGVVSDGLVGTPFYMAPEVFAREEYSVKSDTWALGVTLYEMMARARPFQGHNWAALEACVVEGRNPPVADGLYSPLLMGVLRECLTFEHVRRPTVSHILSSPAIREKAANFGFTLAPPARPSTPRAGINVRAGLLKHPAVQRCLARGRAAVATTQPSPPPAPPSRHASSSASATVTDLGSTILAAHSVEDGPADHSAAAASHMSEGSGEMNDTGLRGEETAAGEKSLRSILTDHSAPHHHNRVRLMSREVTATDGLLLDDTAPSSARSGSLASEAAAGTAVQRRSAMLVQSIAASSFRLAPPLKLGVQPVSARDHSSYQPSNMNAMSPRVSPRAAGARSRWCDKSAREWGTKLKYRVEEDVVGVRAQAPIASADRPVRVMASLSRPSSAGIARAPRVSADVTTQMLQRNRPLSARPALKSPRTPRLSHSAISVGLSVGSVASAVTPRFTPRPHVLM